MRIAYLHYHLKPGGVTSVIAHQVEAARAFADVLIFSSTPFPGDLGAPVVEIPGLAYDDAKKDRIGGRELAERLEKAMVAHWGSRGDILHAHNSTLGKNENLSEALRRLRDRGYYLLLQIHDFAEDGRPRFYDPSSYIEDVHYGVINTRDQSVLCHAGLLDTGVHRLDNRVRIFPRYQPSRGELVLYPVRAIRRKNVGEAIFLHQILNLSLPLGITLPANSPVDIKIQNQWKRYVRKNELNVQFDIGQTKALVDWMKKAAFVMTTSVNEGFGFSFLEPWTAGRAVFGRRLTVCNDFETHGLRLGHLYSKLLVPLEMFDGGSFRTRREEALKEVFRRFHRQMPRNFFVAAFDRFHIEKNVDFGQLDEKAQMEVMDTLMSEPSARREILDRNPGIPGMLEEAASDSLIGKNAAAVQNYWGKEAYGRRLKRTYQTVMDHPVCQKIDPGRILQFFLDPENFTMLRWQSE